MKKYIIGSLLLVLSNLAWADVLCTLNGNGEITDTSECKTQPDEQYITIYKVAVCKTQPVAPTSTSAYDASECKVVFQSINGTEFLIKKNTPSVPTDGEFHAPPPGNYTYGFVEISPTMKAKKVAKFSRAMYATNGTSGVFCWSKVGTMYSVSTSTSGPVDCGASMPSASSVGITSQFVSSLNGSDINNPFISTLSFPSSQGGNITAHLIDSTGKIGVGAMLQNGDGDPGTVRRIIGYLPINLKVTGKTSGLSISFNNSMGTNVGINDWSGGGLPRYGVFSFSGGPFDFKFETEDVR